MNLLVLTFIALLAWRSWKGFKSGLAKEIHGVISLLMALLVLAVVFLLVASIMEKKPKTAVVSVLLLLVVSVACKLLNMVIKSVETLAKLPLIGLANRFLGAAAGALELLIMFWILYVVLESFPMGRFGEQVMAWTEESKLLMNIHDKNFIANWISGFRK